MRTVFGPADRRHQVLLDADDRGRRHPGRHQPDRLDRRGRLRGLPARPVARRRPVGPAHGGRQAAQHPADRAVRGAPHRGRHLQLRLGHDDQRHAVPRHGPRAARRDPGRRLHRQGRARGDPRRRASIASSSASRSPATRSRSSCRASATRCRDGEAGRDRDGPHLVAAARRRTSATSGCRSSSPVPATRSRSWRRTAGPGPP